MVGAQDVWAEVHRASEAQALSSSQLNMLRAWVGGRMANRPVLVFDYRKPGHPMRASFAVAIAHAARDLSLGRMPG
jgi:hypothetical protein